jgi:hypothetical protein
LRRIVLAVVVLVGLGAGLAYWHVHPPERWVRPSESPARRPLVRGDGDVVVLVDDAAPENQPPHPDPAARAWPYAWLNTVTQEFGPCALLQARSLAAGHLGGRRVVVVPAGAQPALTATGLAELRSFAEGGGVVVLESGLASWKAALGLPDSEAVELAPAVEDTSEAWRVLAPALGRLWPPEAAWPPCTAALGRGVVVVVAAPFARTLVDVQQGRPPAPAARRARGRPVLHEPVDFVPDTALLRLRLPALDALEHRVMVEAMAGGPLPRLWVAPAAARGAFLVTHDSELMGDASAWMAEATARWGEPCTYFLADTAFTAAGMRHLDSLGVDLGFHWDRTKTSTRLVRLGRLRLLRQERSAEDQLAGLMAKGFRPAPGGMLNRNHYLLMESPFAHPREMTALGVKFDLSYGPDVERWGYPFATQFPFQPLDENGYPFDLLELPFQYADYFGGVDSVDIQGMIRQCAEGDHGALCALYHPNLFDGRGDVEAFATWERGFTWARAAGLWVGTASAYLRFLQHRASASLVSAWNDPVLSISVRVGDDQQSLALPREWHGRKLSKATLAGTPVRWSEEARWGEPVALVPLAPGETQLEVEYGPPR